MKMSEESYIKDRLNEQIDWYDKKSRFNQLVYKWSKRGEICIAALIPLLSGIGGDKGWAFVIGSLGAAVAVIEGFLSIGKYHENWIEYRSICETLRHEKFMFLTNVGVFKGEEPFVLLVERVESVISKENVNWANLNSTTEEKKK